MLVEPEHQLYAPCEACGALLGRPCLTPAGNTRSPHPGRLKA